MARADIHFGSLDELNDENYGPNNLYGMYMCISRAAEYV